MCLPSLPLEIIISILSLLPARELIRFLVTCKSWYALIKSQEFIKKHLEMSVALDKNFILYGDIERDPEKSFTLLNHKNLRYESELGVPFDLPGMLHNCMIVGSTNGLICLSNVDRFGHTICLTNPSINKHLIFPPSTIYSDESDLDQTMLVSLGFGYHQSTNDFKVVRLGFTEPDWINEDNYEEPVSPPSEHDLDCSVEVFSLSIKVWKKLDLGCNNFPYKRYEILSGVVVNECLHWNASKVNTSEDNTNNKLVIMSFHMGNETFQDIEWPIVYHEMEINSSRCFGEFRGKLGIFSFCQSEFWFGSGRPPCHLWIMEEYGDKDSWTCQAIVVSEISIRMPLTITRNGKVIMRERSSGMIFCYDLINNEFVYLNIQDEDHELNFINFTDS